MNTGHNHHQGDFHTDDIQDAEFQDAEIIDETHEQEAPKFHHQATAQDSLDVEIEDETKDELPEIIIKKNPKQKSEEKQTEKSTNNQSNNSSEADEAISILEAELHKEKDKFTRLFAEFENYKRRTAKERLELLTSAGQDVILSMLPVLDDFDRALVEISKSEDENLLRGVELIHSKFLNTLRSKGLEQIQVATADPFDSDIHEAITQTTAPTEDLRGKVLDVVEKGYKLGDKIIRYPKVVVGQ